MNLGRHVVLADFYQDGSPPHVSVWLTTAARETGASRFTPHVTSGEHQCPRATKQATPTQRTQVSPNSSWLTWYRRVLSSALAIDQIRPDPCSSKVSVPSTRT